MKTIKERVQGFCKRCRTTQPYCPCTPKEQQNCLIYDAYIKGATEQQELDNKQLCEMVLDNQNAIIDKACEWMRNLEGWDALNDKPCPMFAEEDINMFRKYMKAE